MVGYWKSKAIQTIVSHPVNGTQDGVYSNYCRLQPENILGGAAFLPTLCNQSHSQSLCILFGVCSGQNQKLAPENPGSGLIVCMHVSAITVSEHA